MPNYYELLRVKPNANDAEIQSAFDQQYEQWRRLVTHHDPNVVNQANQAIQLLEKIRATLTDPTKRNDYDEAIGIKGVTAGLADPNILLNVQTFSSPPSSRPATIPTAATQRPDVWVCGKCHAVSAKGTRFCGSCGNALGQDCPNCRKLIQATIKFCPECGSNVAEARLIAEREGQKQAFWKAVKTYAQSSEPASYDSSLLFYVRGSYEECVRAAVTVLTSKPGDYSLNLKTQDGQNGIFVAYEGSPNDLRVQVLVETGEDIQRRVFVRFARNTFPVDKPMRRIRQAFETELGRSVTVVSVSEA
jgi:RNA polymerase subunit RPABC4/transcription elongation factor Spt4